MRTRLSLAVAAAAALATAGSGTAGAARLDAAPRTAAARAVSLAGAPTMKFREAAPMRLATLRRESWQGGPTVTDTGETVVYYASDYFADAADPNVRKTWASFFSWLYHGSELGLVAIYQAPAWEVAAICGNEDALGCYGEVSGQSVLIFPGDLGIGVDLEVGAHEYGHHIAGHRLNDPWPAIDWGPKRWATSEGICGRAAAQTAFPGDEGDNYLLNPGEGWAESYRLLNVQRGVQPWANLPWNSDSSFMPGADVLAQALADVQTPWAVPAQNVWNGRFATPVPKKPKPAPPKKKPVKKKAKKRPHKQPVPHKKPVKRHTALHLTPPPQTKTFATLLDGTFAASVTGTANARLELDDATTGAVLVPATPGQISFTICGQRSVVLKVVPANDGTFAVTVSTP